MKENSAYSRPYMNEAWSYCHGLRKVNEVGECKEVFYLSYITKVFELALITMKFILSGNQGKGTFLSAVR